MSETPKEVPSPPGPCPVPMGWQVRRLPGPPAAFVLLELRTPVGAFAFFFDEASAGRLASALGQSARSGLEVASVIPR